MSEARELAQEAANDLTNELFSDPQSGQLSDEGTAAIAPTGGLSADEASLFGWQESASSLDTSVEDRLLDPSQAPSQLESAGVTALSPGSGPSPSPAPAPQLDANQQFQVALLQQFKALQQSQAQQQAAFQEALRSIAPKPVETPVDPFGDMPPELRSEIDKNPQLKLYTEYMAKKAATPAEAYRKEMEGRIAAAQHQREVQRYSDEAQAVAQKVLANGYTLVGPQVNRVTDFVRDTSLALSHAHGGSPLQYADAVRAVLDDAVKGRIAHMNAQAKAKVATRQPQPGLAQRAAPVAIPQSAQTEPTLAEARSAGYRNLEDARWDDFSKVFARRARQGRG